MVYDFNGGSGNPTLFVKSPMNFDAGSIRVDNDAGATTLFQTIGSNYSTTVLRNQTVLQGDFNVYLMAGANSSSGGINFLTGGTNTTTNQRMTITGTGSVGIGTTSPQYPLDVSRTFGSGYSSDHTAVNILQRSATSGNVTGLVVRGWTDGNSNSVTGASIGANAYGSTPTAKALDVSVYASGATITNGYAGYFAVNNTTTTNGYGVYVGGIAATNKWSFYASDSTAASYFAGNVGIRTTSPSAPLNVLGKDTGNGSTIAEFSDSSGNMRLRIIDEGLDGQSVGAGILDSSMYGLGLYNDNGGGKIAFYTGGAHTERMRIDSYGNVGVGTTSPQYKLHVDGGTNPTTQNDFLLNVSETNDNNGVYMRVENRSSATHNAGYQVANQGIAKWDVALDDGTSDDLIFVNYNLGTKPARFSYSTGYLGLGNISAKNALDVRGAMAIGSYAGNNTALSNGLIVSGSVGVGTTTPQTNLHITDNQANQIGINVTNFSTSSSALSVVNLGNNSGSMIGSLSVGSAAASSAFASRMVIEGVTNGVSVMASDASGDIRMYTAGDVAANERLRITSAGNVGVGTTAPAYKFHIHDASNDVTTLMSSAAGHVAGFAFANSDNNLRWKIEKGNGAESGSNAGSDLVVSRWADNGSWISNPLVIQRSTGSIGVGTTAPQYALDINAPQNGGFDIWPIHAAATNSANAVHVVVDNLSATNHQAAFTLANQGVEKWQIGNSLSGNTTNDFFIYNSTTGSAPFYISTTSNVGIGTMSPSKKLEVTGTVKSTDLEVSDGNGVNVNGSNLMYFWGTWIGVNVDIDANSTGGVLIKQAPGTAAAPTYAFSGWDNAGMYSPSQGNIRFSTAATDRVTINSSGNVGIGTTNPVSKLHVSGAPAFLTLEKPSTGDEAGISFQLAGIEQWYITVDNVTPNASEAGDLKFYSIPAGEEDYNTRIHLPLTNKNIYLARSGGSVGVGTTSPTGILDVEGGIAAPNSNASSITLKAQSATGSNGYNGGNIILYPGMPTSFGAYGGFQLSYSGVVTGAIGFDDGDHGFLELNQANGWTTIQLNANTSSHIDNGLALGSQDATTLPLLVNSAGSGVQTVAQFRNDNTSADGTGSQIVFTEKVASGSNKDIAGVAGILTDKTTASYKGALAFYISTSGAAPSEQMRIDSSGHVGVGTKTPIHNLVVAGDESVTFHDDQTQFQIQGKTNSAYQLSLGVDTNASPIYGWMQSSENGVSQRAFALNPDGGSVGIGTTSPTLALSLYGNINNDYGINIKNLNNNPSAATVLKLDADTGSGGIFVQSSSGGSGLANKTVVFSEATSSGLDLTSVNGPLRLMAGSYTNEVLRVDYLGHVGIGTSAIGVKLSVRGDNIGNADSLTVYAAGGDISGIDAWGGIYTSGAVTASGGIGFVYDMALSKMVYANADGQDTYIVASPGGTGNNKILMIPHGTGGVGIGTAAPIAPLEVQAPGASVNTVIASFGASVNGGNQAIVEVNNKNTGGGGFQSGFQFSNNGTPKWTIYNDINGNGGQTLGIYDFTVGQNRLTINTAGSVGVGTTIVLETKTKTTPWT